MSRGTHKSRWVETEIEQNGSVYLLPLRCRLEARGSRIRTVIQTYCLDTSSWTQSQQGTWFKSDGAERLHKEQLDQAACEVADQLCAGIEKGRLHSDWLIKDEAYPVGSHA